MHVQRSSDRQGADVLFELVEDNGQVVAEVSDFLRHLGDRGYSPNTLAATPILVCAADWYCVNRTRSRGHRIR